MNVRHILTLGLLIAIVPLIISCHRQPAPMQEPDTPRSIGTTTSDAATEAEAKPDINNSPSPSSYSYGSVSYDCDDDDDDEDGEDERQRMEREEAYQNAYEEAQIATDEELFSGEYGEHHWSINDEDDDYDAGYEDGYDD